MNKPIISFFAAMLFATTVSYSQNATVSGGQNADKSKQGQTASQSKQGQSAAQSKQGANNAPAASPSNPRPEGRSNANSGDVQSSTRPGGATNENANDVGRYSSDNDDSKSLLNSKEAVARRKKNLTESDTTMKKGSGSAPKNTKNHTGKTNNYKNEATKHNTKQ